MDATKRTAIMILGAAMCALVISFLSDNLSYEERLIRAGLKDAFGPESHGLLNESLEMQALFLDYSESMELALKARIAIMKYGDDARKVLLTYGEEPQFKEILSKYGENIIPIVQYFIENDPFSVRVIHAAQDFVRNVADGAKKIWDKLSGAKGDGAAVAATPEEQKFGPIERGWYAIQNIRSHGHDFLGQFAVNADNKAVWIQTERLIEGVSGFFLSGIKNLETRYALDEQIRAADLFWAGVDVAVFVSAVKALRAVKVARAGEAARAGEIAGQAMRVGNAAGKSGKGLTLLNRTKLLAGRLIPKNALGKAILKSGAAVGLLYVAATNPAILNSIFAEGADLLGINPHLLKVACWAVLIYAICLPLTPILRVVLPVLVWLSSMLASALGYLQRLFAHKQPMAPAASAAIALRPQN
jgi:hypothetical protein